MKLRLAGEAPVVFWLESTYAEREVAKQAGFSWHGGSCRPGCAACSALLGKVWWTPHADTARKLVDVADEYARDVLLPDAPPPERKPKKANPKIPDVNLRLALMEALVAKKIVERPATARGREQVYNEKVRDKLLSVSFDADKLAAVDALGWSTDVKAIYQIFPQWDGEEDEFEIKSLSGLEACKNLREINITMFGGTDLEPLRGLEKLESITLERPYSDKAIKELAPLLELPSLRDVAISAARKSESNADAIKRLKDKHVRVSIRMGKP